MTLEVSTLTEAVKVFLNELFIAIPEQVEEITGTKEGAMKQIEQLKTENPELYEKLQQVDLNDAKKILEALMVHNDSPPPATMYM
jgi:hypothetical protein